MTDESTNPNPAPSPWGDLAKRSLSGVIMAAVFLAALWQGGWLFTWLILVVALLMMREWNALTADDTVLWRALGIIYVTIPCASLAWLRQAHVGVQAVGFQLVLYVILVIIATDIGAYFAGRAIGGPKIWPAISPKKTWAGLGGGMLAAAVVGGSYSSFTPYPVSLLTCIFLGAGLAVIAQAGDFFESWLKRRSGAKDSGALIPGHGGLLDRIDGLVAAVPVFTLLVYLSGIIL